MFGSVCTALLLTRNGQRDASRAPTVGGARTCAALCVAGLTSTGASGTWISEPEQSMSASCSAACTIPSSSGSVSTTALTLSGSSLRPSGSGACSSTSPSTPASIAWSATHARRSVHGGRQRPSLCGVWFYSGESRANARCLRRAPPAPFPASLSYAPCISAPRPIRVLMLGVLSPDSPRG